SKRRKTGHGLNEVDVHSNYCLWPLCGQTGLLHPQLLLTQHLLARPARELRRRSDFRQTGHSNEQKRVESKLHFRCTQPELERCGTKQPCAVAAIADAAFLRTNSRFLAAMQRTSPEQPLISET
ncbi:hypothetical protein N9530_07615, partial [Ascidiaceihabitans sp.]|nr:hypothetical protein [Ascidiaceihabitans sp.]